MWDGSLAALHTTYSQIARHSES